MLAKFRYLTTDLDLESPESLVPLVAAFKFRGMHCWPPTHGADGSCYGMWNTDERFDQPEPNIAAMLTAIESLGEPERRLWETCSIRRDFNIGCDCGVTPWAFNFALSPELLGRIAALGAKVVVTLYPEERIDETDESE
ncbi:MAG TPA: hypothetical protein VGE52_06310 [Pirellulales bacterium]